MINKSESSLGIKYPTYRNHPLHTGYIWLEGKRKDDNLNGLWRVHNNLYDLTEFIQQHPGGSEWIQFTKGTDITEAFESHHIHETARKKLEDYYVSKAEHPRNSPFTFRQNDFYMTLKRRVSEELKSIPMKSTLLSKLYTDTLFFLFVALFLTSVQTKSFFLAFLTGIAQSLTAIAAHNFFHQKDNFRMYYFDFTMMQSREWRISHVLSHHLYTNTVNDLEISSVEPFMQYLPHEKNFFIRYISWFYQPIIGAVLFFAHFLKTNLQTLINGEAFKPQVLLPFLLPVVSVLLGNTIWSSVLWFIFVNVCGGIHFSLVGLNAAHHHPDIFHDGDHPRHNKDWGIYQLDAVMDRKEIKGLFLALTHFGDHALHHLFPTVDQGILPLLYPVFLETCKEFKLNWRLTTQLELVKGQYKQLARISPNASLSKQN